MYYNFNKNNFSKEISKKLNSTWQPLIKNVNLIENSFKHSNEDIENVSFQTLDKASILLTRNGLLFSNSLLKTSLYDIDDKKECSIVHTTLDGVYIYNLWLNKSSVLYSHISFYPIDILKFVNKEYVNPGEESYLFMYPKAIEECSNKLKILPEKTYFNYTKNATYEQFLGVINRSMTQSEKFVKSLEFIILNEGNKIDKQL